MRLFSTPYWRHLLVYLLIGCCSGAAQADHSVLQQGLDLYFAGKLDEAEELLQAQAGAHRGEALFYLGEIQGRQGRHPAAIRYYLQAAELDFAPAMNSLYLAFLNGAGVRQDEFLALDWKRRAMALERPKVELLSDSAGIISQWQAKADQGSGEAYYHLAQIYDAGILAPHDLDKALAYYHKAAEKSEFQARKMLGYFYCRGIGVERDPDKANYWLQEGEHHSTKCLIK